MGKRIRLEAQILARLLHDNVVRIYDFGEADGICFLVMEEVDGTSYLEALAAPAAVERLRILRPGGRALDYAHHQGVIHRDVKPGNVLLTAADQPKLSDFGLSVTAEQNGRVGDDPGNAALHEPRAGAGPAARPSDRPLFARHHALRERHGTVPFTGKSMSVIAQHVNQAPSRRGSATRSSPEPRGADPPALQGSRPPALRVEVARCREEIDRESRDAPTPPMQHRAWRTGRPPREAAAPAAGAAPARGPRRAPEPAPAASPPTARRPRLPLAKAMLDAILAEPIVLTPDERYLCGHYLAYLLGGRGARVCCSAGRSTPATPTAPGCCWR